MAARARIDVHHHVVPPHYRRFLADHRATAGGLAVPDWSVRSALMAMDAGDVATAVLSVSTPGVDVPGVDAAQARAMARSVNEFAAQCRDQHPDRFGFFATLSLPDVEGALEEARYALDELRADGVVLPASVRGRYLGHPDFRPLFRELDRRHAVVLVHPGELAATPVAGLPPYVVDFLLDTTRCALDLARGGVLGMRHLRIVLAHAGGFLPYASYRAAPFLGSGGVAAAPPPGVLWDPFRSVDLLRRFWFDVALSASPAALPSLLAFAAPGHVVFGSDTPYAPAALSSAVTGLLDAYEMPEDVRRSIDRDAALALFPRLAAIGDLGERQPAIRSPKATIRVRWRRGTAGAPAARQR